MSRGPDRSELSDGTDISKMTVDQISAAQHRADHEFDQERHQRRLKLMRMQGDLNRQESRLYWYWAIAITLGMLALLLACI